MKQDVCFKADTVLVTWVGNTARGLEGLHDSPRSGWNLFCSSFITSWRVFSTVMLGFARSVLRTFAGAMGADSTAFTDQ